MFISTETNYELTTDEPFDKNKITWFVIKANLSETQKELQERQLAIQKQIAWGIIQQNGLPAGLTPEMLGIKQQKPVQQQVYLKSNSNSNLGYLNKPLSQQQQLYNKFGLRK